MQPLIDTGIPYNDSMSNDKEGSDRLIEKIFDEKYENKTILVCWEHKKITYLVREIGKKLDNSNYKDFKFWATDPKNGVKGEDDDDLYSMTIIIDPYAKNNTLNCINQSIDLIRTIQY